MGWNDRNPELYDFLYAGGFLVGPYGGVNPEKFEDDKDEAVDDEGDAA